MGEYWWIWCLASNLLKFFLSVFSNCMANTGCLRDYPSILSLPNIWMKPCNLIHQYFPHQNFVLYSICIVNVYCFILPVYMYACCDKVYPMKMISLVGWIMWSVAIGMDPMNKIELAESLTHTLKEMRILSVNSSTVRCLMCEHVICHNT